MHQPDARRQVLAGLLLVLLLGLLFPIGSPSLPRDLGDGPEPAFCEPEASLQVGLSSRGLPLVGSEVRLSALTSKIIVREPEPDKPANCRVRLLSLAAFGDSRWSIVSQPGSSALEDVSILGATLPLDREGRYRVRFNACPDGCDAPLTGGGSLRVASDSGIIDIEAKDGIPVQPETEPVLPAGLAVTEPSSFPDAGGKCQAASSVINPAWVTRERWQGADQYQLLEGFVAKSHISRKDSHLNHDSQDFNILVRPDPPYEFLRTAGSSNLEVEWERDHFPESFRPTRGDRVSVVGYWIHDCSHDNRTEIHPPVMTAVHRPRAVEIPENRGFGSNIRVPGIVTHIWVSRDAGETTRNCSLTGLHQPNGGAGFDLGPHACLPQTAGFDANPIDRVYEFNIYLPRDPREVLAGVAPEVSPPPVEIYTEAFELGGDGGAVLQLQVDETGSFVRAQLDLSEYRGRSYAARVHSAWVVPSADNWDLHRWRVQVDAVDVHADGDRGHDGEWHLWVNTNSIDQEWTMVLDQDLDDGRETFDDRPFSTTNANPARTLGADLQLFPRQLIWVHSSGFEDDALWSDNTGHVYDLKPQREERYSPKSRCKPSVLPPSGCGSYTLEYRVMDRGPFGPARLTAKGQALFDAFTIRLPQAPGARAYPSVALRDYNHPSQVVVAADAPEVRLSEASFFASQGAEPQSISDISAGEWRASIRELQQRGPERLDQFLGELREELSGMFARSGREDLQESFAVLQDHLPPSLWETHFQDLAAEIREPPEQPLLSVLNLLLLALLLLAVLVLLRLLRRRHASP